MKSGFLEMPGKPHIVIISPALANANNGNWQTAWRWSRFLRKDYRVTLAVHWDGTCCDAMIALHARRSAASIAAFSAACPSLPLIVVLTGTDLYKDIFTDRDAQRSLQLATQLVVLQTAGLQGLNKDLRSKAQVIYQSAPSLKPLTKNPAKPLRYFDVTMIGHLRAEKDPATFMGAAKFLKSENVSLENISSFNKSYTFAEPSEKNNVVIVLILHINIGLLLLLLQYGLLE